MTWQERRIVTILSTILAILCAALLVVLGIRYRESREAQASAAIPTNVGAIAVQSDYVSLSYDNGTATLSFSLNENGQWIWADDPAFPLDAAIVSAITQQLSAWEPQQTLTDRAALENAGLDQPVATLTATATDGGTATILFGKTTMDGNSHYVQLNGDESTVYIIADTLYTLMCVPIYDMMVLPELPELPEESIQSILIHGPLDEEGNADTIAILTAQRAAGNSATSWHSGGANVTDDKTVRELLNDLQALAFVRCVDYRPSADAVTICGLDAPAAYLRVNYTTQSGIEEVLYVSIGNRLPDESGRYVRLEGDDTIYLLSTASLDPLMRVSVTGLEG